MTHESAAPSVEEIRRQYGIEARSIQRLGAGLINKTFLLEAADGPRYVLQRLHRMFPPTVNDNIEVVTAHLQAQGLVTPRLLRTVEGGLWAADHLGIWRMMTYVPGTVVERVDSVSRAGAAGELLGRFHAALADLAPDVLPARPGIHDTPRHLRNLRDALVRNPDHPARGTVLPLAEAILSAAAELAPLPVLPDRVVHGDPKISNFIFDPRTGAGICMVDLDTLNRMPLPLELGDALRSWCNPAGEDTATARFSASQFRGALTGYAATAGSLITAAERACLVEATLMIMLELAARFCADALDETYFGWDPSRFPSRSEHNRVRAESQMAAWRSCRSRADELSDIVDEVFRGDVD